MKEYEIRIFNPDGGRSIITSEIQLSDNAAIRSAKKLAGPLKFEVWRGMDCIYGTGSYAPAPPTSPRSFTH